MRVFWTLLKIIIGLAIAIPIGIVVLALTFGVVGALLGLAMLALKLAFIGFVGYGLYRLARVAFAPSPRKTAEPIRELRPVDPYYEAAVRELDSELRGPARG
jgi:hypothetical protein